MEVDSKIMGIILIGSKPKMIPVEYSDKLRPENGVCIKASSWPKYKLFDTKPIERLELPERIEEGSFNMEEDLSKIALSEDKKMLYCNLILPAYVKLEVFGRPKSWVCFDENVEIPALFPVHQDRLGRARLKYMQNPWMSITPSEVFSLRTGLRYARGHCVIAGLGLGWQLVQASKRKQVKKITLVEINESLVKMIMPRIRYMLECDVQIEIGSAHLIIPKLHADSALIDIFPQFGNNEFKKPPHIKKTWVWGGKVIDKLYHER
jgi:hypothetical protein